jgi:hypothetical protein
MPTKIGNVDKTTLLNVALPNHGATYTVISHKFVMDTVEKELQARGYVIKEEVYRATSNGQIATGAYELNHNSDPELSLMFAWTNSYNKQVKFRAVTGAKILANGSYMILGEQGSWIRKHTGTADKEAEQSIIDQITHANLYYNKLSEHKNKMKNMSLTTRQQANLLGVLFAEYNVLSSEQANYVKNQMKSPSYFYANGNDTLWAFYNHITGSLQEAHPKTWLEDQRIVHYLITNEFNLVDPVVTNVVEVVENEEPVSDINQISLLDSITECEAEMANDPEYLEQIEEEAQRFKEEESLANLQAEKESEELINALDSEEDDSVDDTPEITGIPNGNTMSDTDDDDLESISPCVGHSLETEKEETLDEEESTINSHEDEDYVDGVDEVIPQETEPTIVTDEFESVFDDDEDDGDFSFL